MSKKDLFNEDLQQVSAFFKALGHPARLAILKFLAESKVCMTGDISDYLPLSRTTVNQHLKELKELNLIQGKISGVKVNYCINPKTFKVMKSTFNGFFHEIDCCSKNKC